MLCYEVDLPSVLFAKLVSQSVDIQIENSPKTHKPFQTNSPQKSIKWPDIAIRNTFRTPGTVMINLLYTHVACRTVSHIFAFALDNLALLAKIVLRGHYS